MQIKNLTLPEFIFLHGSEHEPGGNPTAGRTLILHVRTATVLELFDRDDDEYSFAPETVTFDFDHKNGFGLTEHFVFAVHYTFRPDTISEIFEMAAKWYSDYCAWEDQNIANGYFEDNN